MKNVNENVMTDYIYRSPIFKISGLSGKKSNAMFIRENYFEVGDYFYFEKKWV